MSFMKIFSSKKLALFLTMMSIFVCSFSLIVLGSDVGNDDVDRNGTMIEVLDGYSGLEDYLVSKLKAKETGAINVSAYNIEVVEGKGAEVTLNLVNAVLNKHPEIFYVNMNDGVGCTVRSGKIETITIKSGYFLYDSSKFDAEVKKVMNLIKDDMSDLEKIMTVHNYLCMDAEYAYEEFSSGKVTDIQHSALGAIIEKRAVCDGYSKAFSYYMNKLGITSYIVTGTATTNGSTVSHAWNQVKLDDKWYFVDVSWDDPVPDWYGSIRYDYFLKSAEDFSDHKWTVDNFEICDSKKYDNSSNVFWKDITSQMYCVDGKIYYLKVVDKQAILLSHSLASDALSIEGTKIDSINEKWYAFGSSKNYYPGIYSRLAYADGKLYYSGDKEIYAYDIVTGEKGKVLEADVSKGYVYGLKASNGMIYYQTAKSPNKFDGEVKNCKLSELQFASEAIKLSGKIKLSKSKYTYDGKVKKPTVTIVGLKEGVDFNVVYSNNKNIGTATAKVTGIGKYTGTLKKTFKIVPKKITLSKLATPKKKVIKVTWKKINGVTGYEVLISKNKNFKSSTKYKVKGAKKSNLTIKKKLSSGKKYYVKVRAYKVVKGKTYYGDYSRILNKKVK